MFYIGLDLGQRRDHTAIAVVEREGYTGHLLVRFLRRVPLGTPYPKVVEMVAWVVANVSQEGSCVLTVDATGVGAPVIDMLAAARLGCEICAVTITGGDAAGQRQGGWSVPKKDLMAGLQVGLESGQLRIAKELRELNSLVRELVDVKATASGKGRVRMGADGAGEHDDLVMALSLACWRAGKQQKTIGFQNRRIPGI